MTTKTITFAVSISYENNEGGTICPDSMKENLLAAIEHARSNGDITPCDISAENTSIEITNISHDYTSKTYPDIITYPMHEDDTKRAESEGWKLSDSLSSGIQLTFCRKNRVFNHDGDAWDFVINRAMGGSEFHMAVIAGIKQQNPEEYALWVNEERVIRNKHNLPEMEANKTQALINIGLSA
ncbi:hypothetical protein QTV49_004777 [Vibrio vulnificus]|nr:hypothetical protein [Vibrio vulnificus]